MIQVVSLCFPSDLQLLPCFKYFRYHSIDQRSFFFFDEDLFETFPTGSLLEFVENRSFRERLKFSGQDNLKNPSDFREKEFFDIPFIDSHNPPLTSIFCVTTLEGHSSKVNFSSFFLIFPRSWLLRCHHPSNNFEAEKQIKIFMIRDFLFFIIYFFRWCSWISQTLCSNLKSGLKSSELFCSLRSFVLLIHVRNSNKKILLLLLIPFFLDLEANISMHNVFMNNATEVFPKKSSGKILEKKKSC